MDWCTINGPNEVFNKSNAADESRIEAISGGVRLA